jgi:DNA-binding beta-propeller fold protein YncE
VIRIFRRRGRCSSRRARLIVAPVLWFMVTLASAQAAALRPVQAIPLPDIDGRIDHFAIDVKGRRAFLAALAKNTVEVVDLKAGRVTRTLSGFAKPQGVRFVAELNRLFVATGDDGVLHTLDGTTLSVLRTAETSPGADAIGYDPQSKYLYVGSGGGDANKESGDLTVINALTGARVAAMVTDAHAGGSVVERHGQHLFVLIPEKAEVMVLDRKTRARAAQWTIPGIEKNVAIALDERNHRLFLGVRNPASIVVLDSNSGAVVASVPTVGTLDGLSFDAAAHRIYTSGGEGFIDVTQQIDADHYERIARLPTGAGARTSTFVPEWRRLYVAVPRDKDRGAELRVFEVAP